MNKKQEIKIAYYDAFHCIADKCSITCCQQWKIEVDQQTQKKWEAYDRKEQEKGLLKHVKKKDGISVIGLKDDKQCPFLNEQKLCSLVIKYGDEILSKTCSIFPREIQEFRDRKEYSLAACCPEAVDLINKQEKITFTVKLEEAEEDVFFRIRTFLMESIQTGEFTNSKNLMMLYYLLLDLSKKGRTSKQVWEEYLQQIEFKKLSDAIDQMEFSCLSTFEERNELFLDLVQSYKRENLYAEYLDKIIELAEKLSKSYDEEKMNENLIQFERKMKPYQKLFCNYLAAEVFQSSLKPDAGLENMIVMFQWMALEYAIIQHAVFLTWLSDGQQTISYTMVRDCIVILSRMTGYDDEDIYDYLEENFQRLIWEWGYLALIIGNNDVD